MSCGIIKDNGFLFCLSDCIPSFVLEMNAALDDKYDTNIKLNQLIYRPHEKNGTFSKFGMHKFRIPCSSKTVQDVSLQLICADIGITVQKKMIATRHVLQHVVHKFSNDFCMTKSSSGFP